MLDKYPFAALTDEDKEKIEDYINTYAPCSYDDLIRNYRVENLEKVLEAWNESKQNLFKMFDGELILRRIFVYKQSIEGLAREFDDHYGDKEYANFRNWWGTIKHSADTQFEIEANISYYYSKFFLLEEAFSSQALAGNAYDNVDYKITFADGTVYKVSRGMKPMKIVHKFIEKFGKPEEKEKNEEMFEELRLWHSRLLNQKTVDGELCLSIHPLDYMTMSSNNNGWSSCMRWADKYGHADPGDYRAGTVECMNSPYIVIAYLHNPEHTYEFDNGAYSWNSKRWRELFIVNEGMITEIKGYPYQDENLTNACITWLKELAKKNLGYTYDNEEVNIIEPIKGENTVYYIQFETTSHMYKDFGSLKRHAARINMDVLLDPQKFDIYTYKNRINDNGDMTHINVPYGGRGTCMFCGQDLDDDGRDEYVICSNCETAERCPICGETLSSGDAYWIEDLEATVCYDCYCDHCYIDNFSEEAHLDENMTEISILLGYDDAGEPIYYNDRTAYCCEPEYNWGYNRVMFDPPAFDRNSGRYYVTFDMIQPGSEKAFCDAYDIYPRDLTKFYADCVDNYSLFYNYKHEPLWEEEKEDE